MPLFEFTEADLAAEPTIALWQARFDILDECASRPDRPQFLARTAFSDPDVDVHDLMQHIREGFTRLRQRFYDQYDHGAPRDGDRQVLELFYRWVVY